MEIVKVEIGPLETLNAIFKIYESSFPANERQTIETLKIRLKTNKEVLFAAKLNGEAIGIGFLFDLIGSDFLLLDYLAVSQNNRGKSIGQKLFAKIKDYAQNQKKHLLMEVDDPNFGEDKSLRNKRVAFYKKNGALVLQDVKYLLPALDGTETTNQILMLVPYLSKSQFSGEEIKDLVKLLYSELYGILGENESLNLICKSVNNSVFVNHFNH